MPIINNNKIKKFTSSTYFDKGFEDRYDTSFMLPDNFSGFLYDGRTTKKKESTKEKLTPPPQRK